jgi:hypothetical protein
LLVVVLAGEHCFFGTHHAEDDIIAKARTNQKQSKNRGKPLQKIKNKSIETVNTTSKLTVSDTDYSSHQLLFLLYCGTPSHQLTFDLTPKIIRTLNYYF